MTVEELKKLRTEAENQYYSNLRQIDFLFAHSNNPHEIGDVITDHFGSIKILSIGVYTNNIDSRIPECTYEGIVLKKDGSPTKKGETRVVYQSNIKK